MYNFSDYWKINRIHVDASMFDRNGTIKIHLGGIEKSNEQPNTVHGYARGKINAARIIFMKPCRADWLHVAQPIADN